MPTIKNKRKLCETSLSDFSIEQIAGVPFYNRYPEMERLFGKLVPTVDFVRCFAQPFENKAKRVIEWFYIPGEESLTRLSDLSSTDAVAYEKSIALRDSVINAINSAMKNSGENERKFLTAALSGIGSVESDNTTYIHDGQILFGIWGMKAKQGRKIEDVIREDVLDHRVFTINYNVDGDGSLSFSSIGRKYGHKLTPSDVPRVSPSADWTFVRWEPDIPQGWLVMGDATFTAVCERTEHATIIEEPSDGSEVSGIIDDGKNDAPISRGDLAEPKKYNVHFRSENGGNLKGITEFTKREGERIASNEVPQTIPDEGYEFVGWNKEPVGYEVHSDTEFVARFRKKEESKQRGWLWGYGLFGRAGCLHALLNWILLALGLVLLFLLLWCFIFGKCHFSLCGCDCDNQPVPTPVVPGPTPDPSPEPVQNPCNTEQASGGEEGYMGYFDMGQQSGHFLFEYDTQHQPDKITIYDGKGTDGTVLYTYEGGSDGWINADVQFNKRMVTVSIEGLESGTVWYFKINCPTN